MASPVWRGRIPAINSVLLAILFFLVPTKIAPAYAVSALMLVLWAAEGRWSDKWQALRGNAAFWILQSYFWLFVVSLAWSDNQAAGRTLATRYLLFLMAAVYFTVAKREHTTRYLAAFAAGVVMCELLAGYNWVRLYHRPDWPIGWHASRDLFETAPFVDRIMFGPIVAFAGYISAWQALTSRRRARIGWALVWAITLIGLSFSAGRAGMVSFALMMGLLTLQRLAHHRVLAATGAMIVMVGSALAMYAMADSATQKRVQDVFTEAQALESVEETSLAHRYTMLTNTLHIIAEQPLLGVGAGDFRSTYKQMNERRSPNRKATNNPHNQLLYTVATTGVFGGLLLLVVWFAPPWIHRHRQDGLAHLRVALPIFFFAICLSESYLWLPNTGLMFVLFSALLYGPAEPNETPVIATSHPA